MKIRLKTKLILSFLLVTLILVSFISVLANYFLDDQFKAYAINKQNQKISGIVDLFTSRYVDWGNQWDASGIESIGVNTLSEGMLLRLKDQNGAILWDAQVHNNGMCTMILASVAQTMQAQNSNFQGGYVEKSYPILSGSQQIGTVDIGYYGPYFYTEADVRFLNTLNTLLLSAAFVAMILSVILGVILARQLTQPITRVIETARKIAGGKYSDRISEKSNTKEIAELTTSINGLAETLGQQENLRKQLTSDVAHELRTPLAILQSHLEAMIDGTWTADLERLENCHGEVVRISKMVSDLEKLTQLEQENLILDKTQFDFAALLQRIVTNFQGDFRRKQVELVFDASPATILADVDKMSQVFINLIANALRYTPAGGQVTVRSKVHNQAVEVVVSDTGIGISEADLPHVFERFYRADKSRTRQTGGSGIGLTIVKSIVEAHQGEVTVQSKPGQGSQFMVTIPILHNISTT
jgi:two-component system sensor histidine kinase BaeS